MNSRATGRRIHGLWKRYGRKERSRGYRVVTSSVARASFRSAQRVFALQHAQRRFLQVLGYAHDLGHPPFGHGGEIALNYCMRDAGGFDDNGQTLRMLSRLEDFSKSDGANLTRRAFLGILKYPIRYSEAASADLKPSPLQGPSSIAVIDRKASKPPKCYLDDEADVLRSMAPHPLSSSANDEQPRLNDSD